MGSKRKGGEGRGGGGDPPMKIRLRPRRRLSIAETEERAPQLIGFTVNPVKVESQEDPEKESHQPELNIDFDDQDLADSDIDVGEVKYVPHPAPTPAEDKFTHEDEEVDLTDSNRINDEVETLSTDSNRRNVAHSTSEPSDSDARVGQTEPRNDTGRENNDNSNISTVTNGNLLPTGTNELHERTLRLHGHVGDDTIGNQHLAGGTTATEPERLSIAPDIEGNVDEAPSGEMQAATGHIELLHQNVDAKDARIQELSCKITLLEDDARNFSAECEVLKEELEEARSENETLQRKLHTKRVDLARQTGRAKMLEEEQRRLVQENSRTVQRLEEELKKKTNLLKNATSDRDALVVRRNGEIGGFKEEIDQLSTENERLSNSVVPQQVSENKRLQEDNADLRMLIMEKDAVIQMQTGDIEILQQNLIIFDNDSKERRADLVEARKLAEEKSVLLQTQQEEATREIEFLKNSISEKDNELAIFKARYFRDQEGNSQLHHAARNGDEQSVKKLIQLGADVNARNSNSETPIILAVSSATDGNATLTIIKYLIEHGSDVFATDSEGQTFLHKLTSNENPTTSSQFQDISEYLVSENLASFSDIMNKDNGRIPFMLAASHVDLDNAPISVLQTNEDESKVVDDHGSSNLSYPVDGNSNVDLPVEPNGNGSIKHNSLLQALKGIVEAPKATREAKKKRKMAECRKNYRQNNAGYPKKLEKYREQNTEHKRKIRANMKLNDPEAYEAHKLRANELRRQVRTRKKQSGAKEEEKVAAKINGKLVKKDIEKEEKKIKGELSMRKNGGVTKKK